MLRGSMAVQLMTTTMAALLGGLPLALGTGTGVELPSSWDYYCGRTEEQQF